MKRSCLPLIVSVVLLAASCGNPRAPAELDAAESCIASRPDSALALIRSIDTTALRTRSLRAHYALLHAVALDKNWIDPTDVGVVMPAVEYYARHGTADQKMKAYYYLGRIQENAGDYASSILSFINADKYAAGTKDFRFKSLIAAAIARMYGQSFDYAEALKWDEIAYAHCLSASDTTLLYSARQRLAIDFNNLGEYSRSDSLYRILESDSSRVFAQLKPDIYSGHALLNVTMGNYDEACRLYEQALSLSPRFNHRNHWGAYAYALWQTGQRHRSEEIFRQLEEAGAADDYTYLVWKSRWEASRSDYGKAYDLLQHSSQRQEDNLRKAMQQTVLKTQRDFFAEETRQESRERKLVSLVCWLLGALFLMTGIWMYFLICRHRKLSRARETVLVEKANTLMAEKDSLQQERTALLCRYAQFVRQHFKDIGELMKTTANVNESNLGAKQAILYEKVAKAWRDVLSDKQGKAHFEQQLNESFNDVIAHLREDFPERDESFYHFAGYIFAGFDTDLLMILMDAPSRDSVYSRKKRLRQEIVRSEVPHKEQFLLLLP